MSDIKELLQTSLHNMLGNRSMTFSTVCMHAMRMASKLEVKSDESAGETWGRAHWFLQELISDKVLHLTGVENKETGYSQYFVSFTEGHGQRELHRKPAVVNEDLMTHPRAAKAMTYLGSCGNCLNVQVMDFLDRNKKRYEIKNIDGIVVNPVFQFIKNYQNTLEGDENGMFFQHTKSPDDRRYYMLHNLFTHQGAEYMRGAVDAAVADVVPMADRQICLDIIKDETGVTVGNYRAVLADERLCFEGAHLGLKTSKPTMVYRAAIAVKEILNEGKTAYIFQQDQTCSGFQIWSLLLGCENLAILTNLRGGEKQDLYSAAGSLARGMYHASWVPEQMFVRSGAKFFVLRIGYGAAASSLARGLILADPQESPITYLTECGGYIPGILEKVPVKDLNPDHREMWQTVGWKNAVQTAGQVSTAYYNALMTISPKLRWALSAAKEMNKVAIGRGEFFTWEPLPGMVKKNARYEVDKEKKVRRVEFVDVKGKPFTVSMFPFIKNADASACPPIFVHSLDGCTVLLITESCQRENIPLWPIHDSLGTTASHVRKIKQFWLDAMRHLLVNVDRSPFFTLVEKYGISVPTSLFPNGTADRLDICGEYYMG
jgi:Mitochondrial DNA-directed RNA polymerase